MSKLSNDSLEYLKSVHGGARHADNDCMICHLVDRVASLEAEVRNERAGADAWHSRCKAALAERDALEVEVLRLRGALTGARATFEARARDFLERHNVAAKRGDGLEWTADLSARWAESSHVAAHIGKLLDEASAPTSGQGAAATPQLDAADRSRQCIACGGTPVCKHDLCPACTGPNDACAPAPAAQPATETCGTCGGYRTVRATPTTPAEEAAASKRWGARFAMKPCPDCTTPRKEGP